MNAFSALHLTKAKLPLTTQAQPFQQPNRRAESGHQLPRNLTSSGFKA